MESGDYLRCDSRGHIGGCSNLSILQRPDHTLAEIHDIRRVCSSNCVSLPILINRVEAYIFRS